MRPQISIICPVFNTDKKFLKKCFKSVITQTFTDWELLIINDCSTNPIDAFLAKYSRKHKNIKVINHEQNLGVDQARFTGIKHSSGEFIMFVDSDDWITKNALSLLHTKINIEKADIVVGSYTSVIDNYGLIHNKPKNAYFEKPLEKSIVQPELFDKYFLSYFGVNFLLVSMCSKLYRKKIIDKSKLSPCNFKMGEDLVFNMKIHPNLSKIAFVKDLVYYYRFGGMTNTSNPTFLKDIKQQYNLKASIIKKYNYNKAIPYIKIELINCFYSHFQNSIIHNDIDNIELKILVKQELNNNLYNETFFIGLKKTKKSILMLNKDYDGIVRLIAINTKENIKTRIKKILYKILKFF